jgi:hypothetical protein
MDGLETQYLEVANRIHLYEVPPLTTEALIMAIICIDEDMKLVDEYESKYFDVIKDISVFKMEDTRMQTYQKIVETKRRLDTFKLLHEFKLEGLTRLETIPIIN